MPPIAIHGPLIERNRERRERLEQLQVSQQEHRERLEAIATAAGPLREEQQQLDAAERASTSNDDAGAWAQLQQALEAADARLDASRSKTRFRC